MGTRGFIGFVADGKTKVGYNHSDSYPDGLGIDVLEWLRAADLASARDSAAALRVVDPESEPTDEDVAALKRFHNPNVGGRSDRPTWYQVLRGTMGEPELILQAGVVEDASGFPADSLFAEFGYVVDFDGQALEVYRGFQHDRHADGRFASDTPDDGGYYPVRLIASWPLAALPADAEFYAAFNDGEDDDE